jgi:hypothetical protein
VGAPPAEQIEELRLVHSDLEMAEEGGVTYLLLKNLQLPGGCSPSTSDALLCPTARDGYESRLFFATQIQSGKSVNWNGQVRILDRNWFIYSWRLNSGPLRLAQILSMHLLAFR